MSEARGRYLGTVLVTGLVLTAFAVTAVASHQETVKAHCTYEVGELEPNVGFTLDYAIDDPVGVTRDGAINDTVCAFHTPDSDPGESSDLGPFHVALSGVITIDGQYSKAQANIVDDVFGGAVGGAMCADFNHDHLCGSAEDGEPAVSFCGTSPVIEVGQDTDGDGRKADPVSGGEGLEPVEHRYAYWFTWADFFPETRIREG